MHSVKIHNPAKGTTEKAASGWLTIERYVPRGCSESRPWRAARRRTIAPYLFKPAVEGSNLIYSRAEFALATRRQVVML